MAETFQPDTVSYVADEHGDRTAAIVPIEIWNEIASEIETRYLLDNPAMRERLLRSIANTESIPLDDAMQRLGVHEKDLER